MKTPVTSDRLKQHFAYSWWKYLLIAVIGFGLVDLVYTVTAYRPPRDKTLGFYVYGYVNEEKLTSYMDHVRETEMSDMEEVICLQLINDENYGPMQLMTYFATGEGDIYLLSRETFLNYAPDGSFVPLENDPDLMALLDGAGINVQSGWRRNTGTGETHLYGIPQSRLPGLSQYAQAQDGYLCMLVTGGNQENAAKFLRILCRDMLAEPPEPDSSSDPQQNGQP